jgi:hypothetical protein
MGRSGYRRRGAGAAVAIVMALAGTASAQTTQEHVHHMGSSVMPFDLAKTMHVFRMTDSGGEQSVVAKAADDKDQIALIRMHLRHEAMAFQNGNYTDPMTLHGADMPGVADLTARHAEIAVAYEALPAGAKLIFTAKDIHLITAIHRWFGAQLSEHGADAKPE